MISIRVKNLEKKYKVYNHPIDRVKEAFSISKNSYHREYFALKNISFEIETGQTIGLIGKNGAGKSTLLKILSNITTIYDGEIDVKGEVSALLELGAGFNPKLTGLENIDFSCTLLGMDRAQIDAIKNNIIEFADIGEFIEQPVSTYSSGMFARLAFSVSIHTDPDILIIDEILSVGDMAFQNKCFSKIENFVKDETKTVIFVTHSLGAIRLLCKEVIWLHNGEIKEIGNTKSVTDNYEKFMSTKNNLTYKDSQKKEALDNNSYINAGEREANSQCFFKKILFLNNGVETLNFITGDKLGLSFEIESISKTPLEISIGVAIVRQDGVEVTRINNIRDEEKIYIDEGLNYIDFSIEKLELLEGIYFISLFLSKPNLAETYHRLKNKFILHVKTPYAKCGWKRYDGIIALEHTWEKV